MLFVDMTDKAIWGVIHIGAARPSTADDDIQVVADAVSVLGFVGADHTVIVCMAHQMSCCLAGLLRLVDGGVIISGHPNDVRNGFAGEVHYICVAGVRYPLLLQYALLKGSGLSVGLLSGWFVKFLRLQLGGGPNNSESMSTITLQSVLVMAR